MSAKANAAPPAAPRRITATELTSGRTLANSIEEMPGLSWTVLSDDPGSGHMAILVRYAPGTPGPMHEHEEVEEFLVVDGTLTDGDGTLLKAGDFVRYEAGSKHDTYSETGCTLLTILRKKNTTA